MLTATHVLGIDAGGTKTVCQLANEDGEVLAEARRGGANLQAAGELEVEKVLHDVMEEALGDLDVRPSAICLGIAGVDRPEDARVVRGIMKRIGYMAKVLVVNDALVALEAGAPNQPGVVVIAGTGSIAYGRNAQNQAARAGGWGYMLGDEGSGYWIGRAALRAVLREADRRGPETQLTGLLLNYYGVAKRAGPDSPGLSRHPAAGRHRVARAVRPGRVHRRGHRGDRDPARRRGSARIVRAVGRAAAGARRHPISRSCSPAEYSGRCRGWRRNCPAACRWRHPGAARFFSASSRRPAPFVSRSPKPAAAVPAYKAD